MRARRHVLLPSFGGGYNIWWQVQIMNPSPSFHFHPSATSFSLRPCYPFLRNPEYILNLFVTSRINYINVCSSLEVRDQVSHPHNDTCRENYYNDKLKRLLNLLRIEMLTNQCAKSGVWNCGKYRASSPTWRCPKAVISLNPQWKDFTLYGLERDTRRRPWDISVKRKMKHKRAAVVFTNS
jgi:hypothetical protein